MSWQASYLKFRDRFAEAMDSRLYTIEHLDQRLIEGSALLWSNDDAAIIAEVKTYPTGARVIRGLIAAGKLKAIQSLIIQAEAWGKQQGCIASVIQSRNGWVRAMKTEGYAVHQTALWKEL